MINNKQQIEKWLNKYGITNYTINNDLSVNVNKSVYLSYRNLKEITIQFNKVNGYFNCYYNQLTSLKGSPKETNGYFFCNNNKLTSLKYCPKRIKGSFYCFNNNLKKIELQYIPLGMTYFLCDLFLRNTSEYKLIQAKIALMKL